MHDVEGLELYISINTLRLLKLFGGHIILLTHTELSPYIFFKCSLVESCLPLHEMLYISECVMWAEPVNCISNVGNTLDVNIEPNTSLETFYPPNAVISKYVKQFINFINSWFIQWDRVEHKFLGHVFDSFCRMIL